MITTDDNGVNHVKIIDFGFGVNLSGRDNSGFLTTRVGT